MLRVFRGFICFFQVNSFRIRRALFMNRTNFECALPSKATEHRRTPRRWGVGHSRPNFRQVLECAAAAALGFPKQVHGPNARHQSRGGFPTHVSYVCAAAGPARRSPSHSWFQIRSWDKTTAAGLTDPAAFPWFRFAGLRIHALPGNGSCSQRSIEIQFASFSSPPGRG